MNRPQIVFFRLITATAFCALSCGAPGLAQQAGASAGAGASVNASGSAQGNSSQQEGRTSSGANVQAGKHSASGSATGSASGDAAASMSQVPAELTTKLDSKTAKAGDAVEAKTTKTVKTAQGVVIPKGSKLLGTVTQAQAHAKGQSQSMLAINFDRVQLRNGQEMMLHSTIDNLSSSNALRASEGADEMMSPGPIGGGGSAGGGLVGGGSLGGGGLVGGAVGGASGALGQAGNGLGSAARSTGSEMGETTHGVANGVGGAANRVNGSVRGAAQEGTSGAVHATSLPGVMLSNSASSAASGTLSETGRNIHLDSGTQMVLSVAAQR